MLSLRVKRTCRAKWTLPGWSKLLEQPGDEAVTTTCAKALVTWRLADTSSAGVRPKVFLQRMVLS